MVDAIPISEMANLGFNVYMFNFWSLGNCVRRTRMPYIRSWVQKLLWLVCMIGLIGMLGFQEKCWDHGSLPRLSTLDFLLFLLDAPFFLQAINSCYYLLPWITYAISSWMYSRWSNLNLLCWSGWWYGMCKLPFSSM